MKELPQQNFLERKRSERTFFFSSQELSCSSQELSCSSQVLSSSSQELHKKYFLSNNESNTTGFLFFFLNWQVIFLSLVFHLHPFFFLYFLPLSISLSLSISLYFFIRSLPFSFLFLCSFLYFSFFPFLFLFHSTQSRQYYTLTLIHSKCFFNSLSLSLPRKKHLIRKNFSNLIQFQF